MSTGLMSGKYKLRAYNKPFSSCDEHTTCSFHEKERSESLTLR